MRYRSTGDVENRDKCRGLDEGGWPQIVWKKNRKRRVFVTNTSIQSDKHPFSENFWTSTYVVLVLHRLVIIIIINRLPIISALTELSDADRMVSRRRRLENVCDAHETVVVLVDDGEALPFQGRDQIDECLRNNRTYTVSRRHSRESLGHVIYLDKLYIGIQNSEVFEPFVGRWDPFFVNFKKNVQKERSNFDDPYPSRADELFFYFFDQSS